MHTNSDILQNFTESMFENRDLFIEFFAANELKVTNTLFRKILDKQQHTGKEKKQQESLMNQ